MSLSRAQARVDLVAERVELLDRMDEFVAEHSARAQIIGSRHGFGTRELEWTVVITWANESLDMPLAAPFEAVGAGSSLGEAIRMALDEGAREARA